MCVQFGLSITSPPRLSEDNRSLGTSKAVPIFSATNFVAKVAGPLTLLQGALTYCGEAGLPACVSARHLAKEPCDDASAKRMVRYSIRQLLIGGASSLKTLTRFKHERMPYRPAAAQFPPSASNVRCHALATLGNVYPRRFTRRNAELSKLTQCAARLIYARA